MRSPSNGTLPRINPNRASTTATTTSIVGNTTSDIILPLSIETNPIKNIETTVKKETIKPDDTNDRLMKLKALKIKYTFSLQTRPVDKLNRLSFKRSLSSMNTLSKLQQKIRIDLKPIIIDKKRGKQQQDILIPPCTELVKEEDTIIVQEVQ
jgi:hypothetical protein